MATFSVPTIARLIRRVQYDFETALANGEAFLRTAFEYVAAKAIAGATYLLHEHIGWGVRQTLITTADEEIAVQHASFWLGDDARRDATKAEFEIQVIATAATTIPDATTWTRSDGTEYISLEEHEIDDAGEFELTVRAKVAGADGNVQMGSTLTLASPVDNLEADALVSSSLVALSYGDTITEVGGGTDQETVDELVVRVLERVQTPPSGGGPGDYIDWAKDVAGVTRAWEIDRWAGGGTVGVVFVRDNDDDIVPDEDELEAVQEHLDEVTPIGTTSYALAPELQPLDPEIELSPNTATIRAAVTAALEDLILREATAEGGTLPWSQINEAISLAAGEEDHVLVSPAADVTTAAGVLLTLGTPEYSTLS